MEIKTKRLLLRPWKEQDFELFAKMNADPRVMEYFPNILTHEESILMANRMKKTIDERGWGLWAVEVPGITDFIGFIGLNPVEKSTFPVHFTPTVEIGWRLAHEFWGQGFATEGAKAALKYGLETLQLKEIVSFTSVENRRSRKVMEKLGMHYNSEDDFDNPKIQEGDRLRRHVLYRIKNDRFQKL